jgi:hypothetical protein
LNFFAHQAKAVVFQIMTNKSELKVEAPGWISSFPRSLEEQDTVLQAARRYALVLLQENADKVGG